MQFSQDSDANNHGWQMRVFRSENGQVVGITRPREEHESVPEPALLAFSAEGAVVDYEQSRQHLIYPEVGSRIIFEMFHEDDAGDKDISVELCGIVTKVDPEGGATIIFDAIKQQEKRSIGQ